MSAIPIVLDTDIGTDVDDAIALGLLLASPEIDLRAVTIVSADVALRARIAKKLLALGGRNDVAVYRGVAAPRNAQRNFLFLGHEGKGIVTDDESLDVGERDAVDVLVEQSVKDGCHVVAIGPQSNVAAALEREPSFASTTPRLTLMGGSLGVSDDPSVPPVEYNLGSDAEASLGVLSSGLTTTIVPLDVTWQVSFRSKDLSRLRSSRSRLVQTLCDAMEIWWPVHRDLFAGTRTYSEDIVCFLHDPLALSILIDPSFVTLEEMRLVPEIVDGVFRLRQSPVGREFQVAIKVEAAAFVDFAVERLLTLT